MKKTLLIFVVCIAYGNLKAQNGFESQFSIGLPSNIVTKENASFNMAVNLGYMFSTKSKALDSDDSDPFKTASIIQYGISAGYTNTIRDENFDNLQLMPIAAVLRVYWLGVFSIGGSFGYAGS